MKSSKISIALLGLSSLLFSSCATLFTSSKQQITFTGEKGISIYDRSIKLGQTDEDGTAVVKVKKGMSTKTLFAQKEGYAKTPVQVDTKFNLVSLWNLLFWPGFLIDLATGQICKYEDDVIEIEMRKKDE